MFKIKISKKLASTLKRLRRFKWRKRNAQAKAKRKNKLNKKLSKMIK